MLSAHQPLETFPALIKEAAREAGGVAQVAGGVPAMCDGVTQGQPGMELSLFSRDVIAMATAVGAVPRHVRRARLMLGVCDKIVPGLVIGALTFGHLPAVFVPAGPMTTGLPNDEKARIRQLYAEGKVGRDELLEAESQVLPRPRHLHLLRHRQLQPDADGDHGPAPARRRLRQPRHAAARRADREAASARAGDHRARQRLHAGRRDRSTSAPSSTASSACIATGGSTNHTIHLVAMAARRRHQADLGRLRRPVGSRAAAGRVYPNGLADVNHFHAAGGMGFLIRELLDAGLLHEDVLTVLGTAACGAMRRGPTLGRTAA